MFGMQLDYNPSKKGYRLLNPPFEPYELRMLIDCVQATDFITEEEATHMTAKLIRLASEEERPSLDRTVTVENRVVRASDSVLNKVDIIHRALIAKRKISFRYFEYVGLRKDRRRYIQTNLGDTHIASPRSLIWKNGGYYLDFYQSDDFYFDSYFRPLHYEVDCMTDICILPEACDTRETKAFRNPPTEADARDFFYGKKRAITIRFRNTIAKTFFREWGEDIVTIPDGEEHFIVTIQERCSEEFCARIASFGCYAKIIAPEDAVKRMKYYVYELDKLYFDDVEPESVGLPRELDNMFGWV